MPGRLVISESEFSEIRKARVKPISSTAHIPFLKKFLGRIVKVIVPKPELAYWMLEVEDLKKLKEAVINFNYVNPYAKQRKEEYQEAINEIINAPDEFRMSSLRMILNLLEDSKDKKVIEIINKIKTKYSL